MDGNDINYESNQPRNYFNYVGGSSITIGLNPNPRKDRLFIYTGWGDGTEWQAVNAYNANGVSVWDTLPAYKKYINVMLNRGNSYYYRAQSATGYIDYSANFLIYDTAQSFSLRSTHSATFIMRDNAAPIAPLASGSTDTLYLIHYNNITGKDEYIPPYYKMAKVRTLQVVY